LTHAAGHDLIFFVLSGERLSLVVKIFCIDNLRVGAVWSINKTPTLVGVFYLL
jgi:hypothetical protein